MRFIRTVVMIILLLHEQRPGFRPRHSRNTALLDVRVYLLQNIREPFFSI